MQEYLSQAVVLSSDPNGDLENRVSLLTVDEHHGMNFPGPCHTEGSFW